MNSLIQVVENEFNLPDFVFHFTLAVLQVFDEGGKALNSSKTIETFPKPTVKKKYFICHQRSFQIGLKDFVHSKPFKPNIYSQILYEE
jgi:hypothetical protein